MAVQKPIIGITMGDPCGIGPEIILTAMGNPDVYRWCRPVVIGDPNVMQKADGIVRSGLELAVVDNVSECRFARGKVDILAVSRLPVLETVWGAPNRATGEAMIAYIQTAARMAMERSIHGIVTAPINKLALQMAGSRFAGHTELLATQTGCNRYAMMLAGERLRVVLVTIHISLGAVVKALNPASVLSTIEIANEGLKERFHIDRPRIAVAGFNPHAGEGGLFGDEEQRLIEPAIRKAASTGIDANGPYPPDTVFYQAMKGRYDAVICMYHDQGLIPFKLIHFEDGVNTTLGLPIVRTSVDHGTAYDIAGTGRADSGSLKAAIKMAALQAGCSG